LTFVRRIKRKNDIEIEFSDAIQTLKKLIEDIECVENIKKLRGYEGIGAKNYFSVFRYNLIPDCAQFPRRSKNPPLTNVNAVLSFLYTLLMYHVETAIEVSGLDTMAGFLHEAEYGKNALVFDLMEEFRTPAVDSVCCALFNLGVLNSDDFYTTDEYDKEINSSDKQAVLLTKEGLKKVIPAFEKKMETLIFYPPLKIQVSWRMIIIEQVKHLKRVILGEEKIYKGFIYK
jgi:CRISPR-associated protein Cas1